jgi:hypothetical protein
MQNKWHYYSGFRVAMINNVGGQLPEAIAQGKGCPPRKIIGTGSN